MAHVLLMPALQICDPVLLFVLMETDDLSFQNANSPSTSSLCS
jgi:hypothetical protein